MTLPPAKGIYINSADTNIISGNIIHNFYKGIAISAADRVSVFGNKCFDIGEANIQFGGTENTFYGNIVDTITVNDYSGSTFNRFEQSGVRGTTAQRPSLTANARGSFYIDNTLKSTGCMIWWNGTAWVDAMRDSVSCMAIAVGNVTAPDSGYYLHVQSSNGKDGKILIDAISNNAVSLSFRTSADSTNRWDIEKTNSSYTYPHALRFKYNAGTKQLMMLDTLGRLFDFGTQKSTSTSTGSGQFDGGISVDSASWFGDSVYVVKAIKSPRLRGDSVFVGANRVLSSRGAALTAQLTSITHTEPGTPDYAVQDITQTTPWGFASHDEANSVLKVILNLQTALPNLKQD